MLVVRNGVITGPLVQVLVLVSLASTTGLGVAGWVVAVACGVATTAAVTHGLARYEHALGPADLVTLSRLALACGVAGLVADAYLDRPAVAALVTLASVALVLDAVDGWVARWTRTGSSFGARFDGEADAFLMLVLSVYVAGSFGVWVLAIGLARYVFGAAGLVTPWMRGQLPRRYWRKVVTAVQGIVLTLAAADVAPGIVSVVALAGAAALLAESFGRDVLWLWRRRAAISELPALATP